MAQWEEIEETFVRLRDFVLNDLERIVSQRHGGNYAVVALVMAACDALARLHYGKSKGHRVLEHCLPREWRPAAPTLYSALRNGLVHGYETQSVVIAGRSVLFQIAWDGQRHLTFTDERRQVLCIVARDLVESLRTAFDSIESELRNDAEARRKFLRRDKKDRTLDLRESDPQAAIWLHLVRAANVMPQPRRGASGLHGPAGSLDSSGQGATGAKGS
jgi:hypothetical protein